VKRSSGGFGQMIRMASARAAKFFFFFFFKKKGRKIGSHFLVQEEIEPEATAVMSS
jgi:hypothetical protein